MLAFNAEKAFDANLEYKWGIYEMILDFHGEICNACVMKI